MNITIQKVEARMSRSVRTRRRSTCSRVPHGTVFQVEERQTDREVCIALLSSKTRSYAISPAVLLFGEHASAFTTAERFSLEPANTLPLSKD